MLRGFILGFVVAGLVIAAAGYIAITHGAIPAAADRPAGRIEIWVATHDLRATLAAQAPKKLNPVPLTAANLTEGMRLYGENCIYCHGTAAGDAAASRFAKGEAPRPPQFATDGVEDDPEGYTFWKVKHGIRFTGMPAWRGALTDQQIWTLTLFLKHMDKLPPGPQAAWKQMKVG
jgi:mono/diheme cytochrome c family protein